MGLRARPASSVYGSLASLPRCIGLTAFAACGPPAHCRGTSKNAEIQPHRAGESENLQNSAGYVSSALAIVCPVDLNTAVLRAEISTIYGRMAAEPGGQFHFHRGPAYAAEFLG